MKEPVGVCIDCGEIVYCEGGHLAGIILEDHTLRCSDCHHARKELNKEAQ
ncbi:hypothetical protein GCM10011391_29620 [Pullulanibacillus camelliae]|uniref:Uncharacterized protein n=1 Tax=Pullulanibacillus camelliae TaxID=1707096 RepID=A0A8J3DXZ7_9BACL|nr:hypothetical protein [Pullulanibacillus camelliae]GGE48866.1 hypothetical protein GCM10011391_29620 [Pullulanibacillus camelliae]